MSKARLPTGKHVGDRMLNRFSRFFPVTPRPWKTSTGRAPCMVRVLPDTPIVRLRAQRWLEYMYGLGYNAEMVHRTMRLEGFDFKVVVLTAETPEELGEA